MNLQFRLSWPLLVLGNISVCMWNRDPGFLAAKRNLFCIYQNWQSDKIIGDRSHQGFLLWFVACLQWMYCMDGISSWWLFPSEDTICRDKVYLCCTHWFECVRDLLHLELINKESLFNMCTINLMNPGCIGLIVYVLLCWLSAGLAYGGHLWRLPNVWKLHTNVESPHVSGTVSGYEERTQPLKVRRLLLWMWVSFVWPCILSCPKHQHCACLCS